MENNEKKGQIELKICEKCGKQCSLCKWFDVYYTLDITKFNKTKYGWCCKHIDIVQTNNTCDLFERKQNSKRCKHAISVYLSMLLTEITELHKVINAYSEDKNEL